MMSTTLNKLEYLDETKGQIKTALNQFGAGITDETTFRDYTNKIEGIYNNWPKVTGSGTEITLNNTKAAKMVMDIKGNSMQGDNPSPESPQTIYSAGDNNSITEKIYTGNMFDKDDSSLITNAYINSTTKAILTAPNTRMLHVSCSPNTTYTISKIVSARFTVITSIDYTYSAGAIGTNIASDASATSLTITSGANDRYICVFYYYSDVDTLSEKTIRDSILVEPGSIAHSYTDKPFAEQNISIPCQQPMRSIGNVRDEFVKVNGTWYERHNINSIVLTGEEEVTKGTNAKRIIISTFSQLNYCTNSGTRYTAQCSHENSIRSAASTESNSGMGFYNSKIWWNNDYFENMTVEQAQTFLATEYQAGHPVTVNHIPPTPTDLPCTQAQIEVLEGLQQVVSYDTQTNINTTDTTPAYVEASALEKGGN